MHALCITVAKSINEIHSIIDRHTEDEENYYWDYAGIGGRYSNIIPVTKNAKVLGYSINDNQCPFDGYPPGDCNYVNIARCRNVIVDECLRQRDCGFVNPYNPYTFIISEDGEIIMDFDADEDERQREKAVEFIFRHPNYFIAVIDYHY